MAEKKKRGFMSWLGFGRKKDEQTNEEEAHLRLEEAKAQEDAIAKAKAEEDAIAQVKAEEDAIAQAKAEEEAIAKAKAEEEAIAKEKAEEEAIAKAKAEEEALAKAKAEEEAIAQAKAEEDAIAKAEEEEELKAAQALALLEEEAFAADQALVEDETKALIEQEKPKREHFFTRLKRGLQRTKANFSASLSELFSGKKINDALFEELEEQLLIADLGIETTTKIIKKLTDKATRKELKDSEALYGILKQEMADILKEVEKPLEIKTENGPFVILMVGVNGAGKTTTIGKLAKQFQDQGKSVMLAAGDTFRAAAVEQLQVWGARNNVTVIAQHTGADSASVIFDAIEAAKARGIDVVIADTAGRLQNKANLMEELRKIVRVMKKIDENAPHEIMLTLDAGTGQNAISQARLFNEIAPISGISLTKLDGTAKGGVIFALADQFNIPIRYIGIGEGIDDLRPFAAEDFIDALFNQED